MRKKEGSDGNRIIGIAESNMEQVRAGFRKGGLEKRLKLPGYM
jgi:hypothetical protein